MASREVSIASCITSATSEAPSSGVPFVTPYSAKPGSGSEFERRRTVAARDHAWVYRSRAPDNVAFALER